MGISENHNANGQGEQQFYQQQQHHAGVPVSLHHSHSHHLHPYAARRTDGASGQVHPSDHWPEYQHQQSHAVDTKYAPPFASASEHHMDIDQYEEERPEGLDDRRSPMSPSGALDLSYRDSTDGDAAYHTDSNNVSSSSSHHSRPLPALSHFHASQSVMTPLSRFMHAHGYAADPASSPSNANGSRASFGSDSSGIRLPSLPGFPGTPPLSPRRWPASPRVDLLASPAQRGFPLTASESLRQVFPTNNRAGFASSPSSSPITLAPLRPHGLDSPRTTTTTPLPSLSALATSLPHPDDVSGPFLYHRSASCPSDAMTRTFNTPESVPTPLFILNTTNVPRGSLVRSSSVDAETAFTLRSRSLLTPPQSESQAIQRWLEPDRPSLNSLAESAHALQLLEQRQSRSPSSSSGPSSPMHLSNNRSSEDDEAFFGADGKREKKLCSFPQCTSNAVTRGKCISHGGGRRCQKKGCTRGAQSKGLCVAHGGGRICRERGCSNIQRSMGLCIRHGGGKRCSMAGCQKGVVRQDLCTAHGGKRKCKVDDCTKHVKKRGLCRSHANSLYASSS